MIEVGREQAQRHGVKNVDYRLGDMEEIPMRDARSIWSSSRSRCITRCTRSARLRRRRAFCGPAAAS